MNTSDWYELASPDDWVWGSDSCPILPVVEDICKLGIVINRTSTRICDEISTLKSTDNTNIIIPKLRDTQSKTNHMISKFENLLISGYGPTEEDLPIKTVAKKIVEETPEKDIKTDEIIKAVIEMKSDLKSEDVEAKTVADEIIEKSTNPLQMFKDTIKIIKDRADVQKLYKSTKMVTVTHIVDLLGEIDKLSAFIHSTLVFARDHGGDKDGIRLSVLYFMGMIPERHVSVLKSKGGS